MAREKPDPDLSFFTNKEHTFQAGQPDNEILKLILNAIPHYVFWKDRQRVYQGCNKKFADAAGLDHPDSICGLTDHDLPWTKQEADFYRLCDERVMLNNQAEYNIIESQIQADGILYWLRTNKVPLLNRDGEVIGILGAYDDVTDLIEKEERLRHYEIITASVDDLMAIIDSDYRYLAVNDAYCIAYAQPREFIIGKSANEIVGEDVFEKLQKPEIDQAFSGRVIQFNSWHSFPGWGERHINFTYYPVFDDTGTVINIVTKGHDSTKTKKLENQLQQVQKMEAIGRLAGGIAHDFNNILSVISGYSDICLQQMDEDNPFRSKIEQISQAGTRGSSLTQQLLGFSRKQVVRPQSLNLADEIKTLSGMLERMLGANIEIETVLEIKPWLIKMDRSQFEQIILNLAVNSRDAMSEGGNLTLEIINRTITENEATHYALKPGDHVMLAVTDNGIGMNPTIQARSFEPFFTTKPKEIGTGFGLSTVYSIVKQNNGTISVESKPGIGTCFTLLFPRSPDIPQHDRQDLPGTDGAMAQGSGTILLAEDDHALRTMCVGILADLGYTILEASNGKEAIESANRFHGKIDLLLTDVVMPEMSGPEAAAVLSSQNPDIKVLFMSGYTENAVIQHGVLENEINFIHKPITPKTLARAVQKCLTKNPEDTE